MRKVKPILQLLVGSMALALSLTSCGEDPLAGKTQSVDLGDFRSAHPTPEEFEAHWNAALGSRYRIDGWSENDGMFTTFIDAGGGLRILLGPNTSGIAVQAAGTSDQFLMVWEALVRAYTKGESEEALVQQIILPTYVDGKVVERGGFTYLCSNGRNKETQQMVRTCAVVNPSIPYSGAASL